MNRTYTDVVGGPVDQVSIRDWKSALYNNRGQLIRYTENSTAVTAGHQDDATTKTWTANTYDLENRILSFHEVDDTTHRDPVTHAITATETTVKVWDMRFMTVPRAGNSNLSMKTIPARLLPAPVHWDSIWCLTFRGMKCITMSLANSTLITRREPTQVPASTTVTGQPWRWMSAVGRSSYHEAGTSQLGRNDYIRTALAYNGDGFVTKYHDEGLVGNQYIYRDWGTLAKTDKLKASEAPRYFVTGLLKAFAESGATDAGKYQKAQTATTYTPLSETLSYTENGWTASQGSYDKEWNTAVYDQQNHIHSYHQEVTNNDAKTKTISDWFATEGYNEKGQLLGNQETGTEWRGETQTHSFVNTWLGTFTDSYNDFGQQVHFLSTNQREAVGGADSSDITREWGAGRFTVRTIA